MFSINKIAVVNGRPTLWGDAIPALLWGAGFKIRETMSGDNDHRAATCEIVRPSGDVVTRSFGVKDARKAGLWGKQGPWTQYPDRMLAMRARGFCARDAAADVLGGLYLKEEIEEDAPAFDEPARKSAYRARKDGDFEVFKAAVDKCTSEAELDDVARSYSGTLATMPRKWEDHCDEYVALKRAKLADATPEADAPIADVDGFLAKLQEDRGYCNSAEDVAEVAEANADMIARLSPADRLRAAKILTVEE
jgi:hypothetical protein